MTRLKLNIISKVHQKPREIIVTAAQAYHFGFNSGLNAAEAVNFAHASWANCMFPIVKVNRPYY